MRRNLWLTLFLALNAAGLGVIVWRIEALRQPPGKLVVVRLSPDGEAQPAETDEVKVEFGAPLAPETVKEDALRLVPPVPGELTLEGGRTLCLKLREKLRDATRYRLLLSRELRGLRGEEPPEGILGFTTPALSVQNVSQAKIEADRSSVLAVRFSGPVNPYELEKHLDLTDPEGGSVRFAPVGGKTDREVRVRIPYSQWEKLHLKIAKGLTGTEGPLPLEEDYKATVQVAARLRFVRMEAQYRGWQGAGQAVVRIRTNSPIDAAAADPFVEIDPPIRHTFDASGYGLDIVADFQPGQRYRVTLKAGLPAGAAGTLERDVTRAVWFGDRPPGLRFAYGGGYLSPDGLLTVPVRSVNVRKATLSAQRLYSSNIVEYVLTGEGRPYNHGTGERESELRLSEKKNEEVETLVDLRRLVKGEVRGVFGLEVRSREDHWRSDHAAVVVTDLGLSARLSEESALVWATSLRTAEPAPGVSVTVYSDRRQELGAGFTGEDGVAKIALRPAPKGEEPALVVAVRGEELSYLALSEGARSRGKDAAAGRSYLARGYEALAFTERGVYRPGDTVRFSALVRGTARSVPEPLPLDLVVRKPSGRVFMRKALMGDINGRLLSEVAVPTDAPSGRYRVSLHLPGTTEKALGSTSFRVADYIPRTLRMKLSAPEGRLSAKKPLEVKVHVEHLFGDPAVGLDARGRVRYRPRAFRPEGWRGYTFGDGRCNWHTETRNLTDIKLNGEGNAEFTVPAPGFPAPAAIRADVEIEVLEPGGRALVEGLSRELDPWPFYLGVKRPEGGIVPGLPRPFELAAVRPDGKAHEEAKRFRAQLYRLTYSNVLRKKGNGRLVYDWTEHRKLVATAEGDFTEGRARPEMTPEHPGPHWLLVESEGGCPVTLHLYVSGPGAGWMSEDPEALALTLDRDAYEPGGAARLRIRAPFGGTALVTVETDRVLEHRVVEIKNGDGAEIFAVKDAWRPNAYVTATLVRPVQPEEDWRPHRASGAIRLVVDCADRKLDLAVESPPSVRPGRETGLAVRVRAGGAPQAGAAVVLMAVDEGVLALTGYRAPSPWDFFYAARRLGVREYDMFSRLAPELAAWRLKKKLDPGGGGEENAVESELGRRLNPIQAKRVKTAVLYAGALVTDEAGLARATFAVPEYIGELRVMAVATRKDRFGSVTKALPVKSPLMARPSWPRFLAPDDTFEVPVTVFNRTPGGGEVVVDLSFKGPLQTTGKLPVSVEVPAGGEKLVRVRLRSTGVGKAEARLTARLGGEAYTESVELPVRPAAAFARRSGTLAIEAGASRRLSLEGEFLAGTARASLVVAGDPRVELAGALRYLLSYPYGCVEQTTSRLVPLVYLRELARLADPETVGREEVEELMAAGFLRLRMMQAYGGGLAMWPGSSRQYPWGSLYAADLLVEARRAGYEVPENLLDPLLDYLRREIKTWATAKHNGRPTRFGEAAYACYVLARAGTPPYPWMARLEEVLREADAKDWGVPTTGRFHLAAAYLAAGQGKVGKGFIADAQPSAGERQSGGYLDSPVREAAIMLLVLLDVEGDSAQIPALAERLRKKLRLGTWGTTQENAFALMALGKYARKLGDPSEGQVTVTMPDGTVKGFAAKDGWSTSELKPGQSVEIGFEGKGKVHTFWHAEGVPADGKVKEEDSGFSIRRVLYTADGKTPADPKALKQGELYQVALRLRSNRTIENLVITDLLHAGLEIVDPNLKGTTHLGPGEKNSYRMRTDHVERRDDRILVFAHLTGFVHTRWGVCEYRYAVRAVTAGEFVLPAAEAACMYDPGLYSVHGRGMVRVQP